VHLSVREVEGERALHSKAEKRKKTMYIYIVPKSHCFLSVKATYKGSIK
jgi:hypothetical protein